MSRIGIIGGSEQGEEGGGLTDSYGGVLKDIDR